MSNGVRYPWGRGAAVAVGLLAILLLAAPPVEARFKFSFWSTSKSKSAPVANKSHTPSAAPDPSKAHTKLETGRPAAAPQVAVAPQNRGIFQRILDWVLWRRPAPAPTTAPAPAAPAPAPPRPVAPAPAAAPVVAAAPATSAPPPVVAPVAMPVISPSVPGVQGTGSVQRKEGKSDTPPAQHIGPAPTIRGYILHLTNGSRISVSHYEQKGDQVIIPQYGGTVGLSRSLIARIEELTD